MRRNQSVTIAALIIAIVGLSIGFAAFSNTLTIRSSASVTPDESNFSVVFSTNASTLETNPVTPSSATLGENGTINNRAGNPRLTGLKAKFTQPGDTVVYNLYVLNNGQYDAYLTNIEFTEVEDNKTVKCTSGSGATDTLTQLACQDISIKLELGTAPNNQEFTPANNGALSTARLLTKGTSEAVKITITYKDNTPNANHYVDGPVTVEFGDILLLYRSTSSSVANIPVPEEDDDSCVVTNVKSFGSTCTLSEDNDSSGTVTKGDKVTCGTESFYVIENPSNGIVKMLTEWNLNVREEGEFAPGLYYSYTYCESTVGYEDSHVRGLLLYNQENPEPSIVVNMKYIEFGGESGYLPYGGVKFDSTPNREYGYWATGDNHDLNTSVYTDNNSGSYPAYVYDNNATLKTFVDTYVGYLNSAVSGANAQGRLIKYEELEALGCSGNDNTCVDSPATAPAWVYQTSYWSGSTDDSTSVWGVTSASAGSTSISNFGAIEFNSNLLGVRPVIEMSSNVININ